MTDSLRMSLICILAAVLIVGFDGCGLGHPAEKFTKFGCIGHGTDQFGPLIGPLGVQIGTIMVSDSFVPVFLVADAPDRSVKIYDLLTGHGLVRLGGEVTGDSSLLEPHEASIPLRRGLSPDFDSAVVLVADTKHNRIARFGLDGSYRGAWGTQGSSPGQFSYPTGIDTDDSGFVYVLDSGNCRVQVFDTTGVFVRQWGSSGTNSGQFRAPIDVAVGYIRFYDQEVVAVSDCGNGRVEIFDRAGNWLGRHASIPNPGGLTIPRYDQNASLLIISRSTSSVYQFVGSELSRYPLPETNSAYDVAFLADYIVSDVGQKQVCHYQWLHLE